MWNGHNHILTGNEPFLGLVFSYFNKKRLPHNQLNRLIVQQPLFFVMAKCLLNVVHLRPGYVFACSVVVNAVPRQRSTGYSVSISSAGIVSVGCEGCIAESDDVIAIHADLNTGEGLHYNAVSKSER